jgi:sugar (pentulose or hexulose) kinase
MEGSRGASAPRELLLGLDLGTTSCKAAVVTPDGEEIAHGQAPIVWTPVATGAEIAPDGFVECALAAARAALSSLEEPRVVALGVSGMAETGVLLGRDGEPVVPSIAWYDSRGEDEAGRIDAELQDFRATTGLTPRALRTVAKYRWLRDNVPESERGVRWLSVGEWVVHRLGGEQGAELSLASRTGWLDLHSRGWWDEAVAWSGAPPGLLPEPAFAGTPLGTAGDALPAARGAVLAVGGHDHLSAAVGAGAVGEGDVLDSWGTAEALVRAVAPLDREAVAQAVDDDIMVGWHAVPERQNLLGAMRSGAALGRVLALLGVGPEDRDALERAALEVEPEGIELIGLNDYRVGLVNIGADPSPAIVWRAALESAGRGARELLDKMARVAGPHTRLVMAGGWSEGVAARAIKEAHVGPFERSSAVFMGARGAALTAGRAAGLV